MFPVLYGFSLARVADAGQMDSLMECAILDENKAGPKVNIVAKEYDSKESYQYTSEVSSCVTCRFARGVLYGEILIYA
jgi:hypothetical protein